MEIWVCISEYKNKCCFLGRTRYIAIYKLKAKPESLLLFRKHQIVLFERKKKCLLSECEQRPVLLRQCMLPQITMLFHMAGLV